jgi:hypothetical protein
MQATPGIMRTAIHAGQACVERVPFSVSVIRVYVVSTGARFVEQTWTGVVLAALDQSDLPAFLLYSSRLSHQVMSASAHRLERAPTRTSDSPTTFTGMLICIRAWPASLCRGVPLTGLSHPTCSRTGRVLTKPALTALPCRETENPSCLVHAFYSTPAGSACQGFGNVVCISVAAVVNVISITNFEIGAHAPVSLCALLLLAFLLTSLTLTGLARLAGLPSLVGLTTKLATSTA